jgi:xylulokinase
VFGKKVTRPCVTDASYGSALLAGVGVGVFTDVKEAVLTCLQNDKVFMPNQSNHKKYQKLFKVYINIHDNLKNIYKDIHQIIN